MGHRVISRLEAFRDIDDRLLELARVCSGHRLSALVKRTVTSMWHMRRDLRTCSALALIATMTAVGAFGVAGLEAVSTADILVDLACTEEGRNRMACRQTLAWGPTLPRP